MSESKSTKPPPPKWGPVDLSQPNGSILPPGMYDATIADVNVLDGDEALRLAVWSRQHRDGLTRQRLAEILTNCGLPVTERALDARALKNTKPVEGTLTMLTDRDRLLWAKLEMVIGEGPLTRLLAI